jgi:hypothetical protein
MHICLHESKDEVVGGYIVGGTGIMIIMTVKLLTNVPFVVPFQLPLPTVSLAFL